MKQNCKKNQTEFKVKEKVIKKKDKLYVKLKGYNNSCNHLIDKRYHYKK